MLENSMASLLRLGFVVNGTRLIIISVFVAHYLIYMVFEAQLAGR